ncbi:hypothetical protein [Alicyclobacillus sendaiensis]|uniref:hypothetical protein n=2 Tax=Alicyclobacillus sendaiensis TaxID=192387 RepID=UPI002729E271|nr:hypothetical protein [Alicyclobacillus sendaiensis]
MMYPRYRTMERYEFIKGIITEISDTCVHIVPYGANKELIAYFDPNITEFWSGGRVYHKNLAGRPGDQGAATTFRDDNGKRLVERLFVNQEHVRGTIELAWGNKLLVQQDGRVPHLNKQILFTIRDDATTFQDKPVDLSSFKPGQYIAGIGEIQGPSHLDAALIEIW